MTAATAAALAERDAKIAELTAAKDEVVRLAAADLSAASEKAARAAREAADAADAQAAREAALKKTLEEHEESAAAAANEATRDIEELEEALDAWRERAEHPDIAAHLALRGREAALDVYQSNPG